MAYDTKELLDLSLKAICEKKLIFIDEIISYLPCSLHTFYDHKLQESQLLKDALTLNKVSIKQGLRNKWYEKDVPVTQLALYRLTSTPEEHKLLNQSYVETKTKNEDFDVDSLKGEIKDLIEELQVETGEQSVAEMEAGSMAASQ